MVKIEGPKYKSFGKEVNLYEGRYVNPSGEQEIPSGAKVHLETPFKVFHKRGVIERLQVEGNEPEIVINIKKSLVAQLQLDLFNSASRSLEQNYVTQTAGTPTWSVMEPSFLGECETSYVVNPMPGYMVEEFELKESIYSHYYGEEFNDVSSNSRNGQDLCHGKQYYEVIKSKNFDNCKERPAFNFASDIEETCDETGSSSCGASHSSVSKYIICGSQDFYLLRKVSTENQHISSSLGLFKTVQKLRSSTKVTLELIAATPISSFFTEPTSPKVKNTLLFEFPETHKIMSTESQKDKISVSSTNDKSSAQSPRPQLRQNPNLYFSRTDNIESIRNNVMEGVVKVIELSKRNPEKSFSQQDVGVVSLLSSMSVEFLSLEDIQTIERDLKEKYSNNYSTVMSVFYDIVSHSGTNPAVMFIKEKIQEKSIEGEKAAWLVSKAITNVMTPTTELIQELISLVKNNSVQEQQSVRSLAILSLTDLIYRACVDLSKSEGQFPVKMYGDFCSDSNEDISADIVLFLKEKLLESGNDQNKLVTYVQALGNLGLERASRELLEIIEGKLTSQPQIRSLAAYNLLRSAQLYPTNYKPVILDLILNNAENTEVRIAAVTILPYTQPSSAELKKVAISTWFSSSRQVSNFISSTFNSLRNKVTKNHRFQGLAERAKFAYTLCKPTESVTLPSFNSAVSKYLESLGLTTSARLQVVASPKSAAPTRIFGKAKLNTPDGKSQIFEASLILQGSQYLMKNLRQMYNSYSQSSQDPPRQSIQAEIEKLVKKLSININNQDVEPQLHMLIKLFNSQYLYTLDSRFVSEMVQYVSSAAREFSAGTNNEFTKVMSLGRSQLSIPSESGFVLHIYRQNPVVITLKNSFRWKGSTGVNLDEETHNSLGFELSLQPVVNYKHFSGLGVYNPFDDIVHSANVELNFNVYLPINIESSFHNGLARTSLKLPTTVQNPESTTLISLAVQPVTILYPLAGSMPRAGTLQSHKVLSKFGVEREEKRIGQQLGLSLKTKIESVQEINFANLYTFLQIPEISVNPFKLSLELSSSSPTKELEFITSFASGRKSEGEEYSNQNEKEKRICSKYSQSLPELYKCIEVLKKKIRLERQTDSQVENWCKEDKSIYLRQQNQFQQQQQQQRERLLMQQDSFVKSQQQVDRESEARFKECKMEKQLCYEEAQLCKKLKHTQGTNSTFFDCSKVEDDCINTYMNRQEMKQALNKITSGSAYSLLFKAQAFGESRTAQARLESYVSIGREHSERSEEKTFVQVKNSVKPFSAMNSPCYLNIKSIHIAKTLASIWNTESILREPKTAFTKILSHFGCSDNQVKIVRVVLQASQSPEQVQFAQSSQETQRCQRDESNGRKLSEDCKQSRKQAMALDKVEGIITAPSWLAQNPLIRYLSNLAKAFAMPGLSEKVWSVSSKNYLAYKVEGKVSPNGAKAHLKLTTSGYKAEVKDAFLGKVGQKLFPVIYQDSFWDLLPGTISNGSLPVSCSIEQNQITTFDKLSYGYRLNNCEHIVVQEKSLQPSILITTKNLSNKQLTKVFVNAKKYELEVSPGQGIARLTINNQERNNLINTCPRYESETFIKKYKDGVYAIVVPTKGIKVYVDGERLEVKSWPTEFKNSITGLCGDMNDEKTADIKTPESCIMSSPKLAAYSFMIRDSQCEGIPQEYETPYQTGKEECHKYHEIPSKVSEVFIGSRVQQNKRQLTWTPMGSDNGNEWGLNGLSEENYPAPG